MRWGPLFLGVAAGAIVAFLRKGAGKGAGG